MRARSYIHALTWLRLESFFSSNSEISGSSLKEPGSVQGMPPNYYSPLKASETCALPWALSGVRRGV